MQRQFKTTASRARAGAPPPARPAARPHSCMRTCATHPWNCVQRLYPPSRDAPAVPPGGPRCSGAAKAAGITHFARAPSLNDEPLLSTAMAEIVAEFVI